MIEAGGSSSVTLAAGVATPVLPNRGGRRVAFTIVNTGAAVVDGGTMSDSEVAVAGKGLYLLSGGTGQVSDSNGDTYRCWQGAISMISTVGTTLSVWERVRL